MSVHNMGYTVDTRTPYLQGYYGIVFCIYINCDIYLLHHATDIWQWLWRACGFRNANVKTLYLPWMMSGGSCRSSYKKLIFVVSSLAHYFIRRRWLTLWHVQADIYIMYMMSPSKWNLEDDFTSEYNWVLQSMCGLGTTSKYVSAWSNVSVELPKRHGQEQGAPPSDQKVSKESHHFSNCCKCFTVFQSICCIWDIQSLLFRTIKHQLIEGIILILQNINILHRSVGSSQKELIIL